MTETKQDVFDDLVDTYADAIAGGGQGSNDSPDDYRSRYAAAPAEVVKVPEDVCDYIKWGKEYRLPLYMMMSFKFVRSQKFEKLTDAVESWIIDYSEQFARAYLAWPNVEVEHD